MSDGIHLVGVGSEIQLRLDIEPIGIMRSAQVLESLINIISGEIVAEAGLKLRK